MKNTPYNRYLQPNRRNLRVVREIGVEELDGDVRFHTGTEMEMWLFRVCAMKNMQYNHRNLQPSRRNFGVLQEIVVEEHDGDVVLYTSAMGQIPCSTERIASYLSDLPRTNVTISIYPLTSYCAFRTVWYI